MNKIYIRTDKNGTKIYHDHTCPRCGGKGYSEAWIHTGLTCYKCGGSGQTMDPRVIKEYTPEYRAILDARAAKRQEKKIAKIRAEHPEWKAGKGFVNDRIFVVGIRNTFDLKDDIKAAGGRYNEFAGWYFSEPHEEFQTIEITAEEALVETAWGYLEWRNTIREIVEAQIPAEPTSDYIGQEGDKVNMEVTLTHTGSYQTRFGTTYVHTFKDAEGNVLVWKTSTYPQFEVGTIRIKGTIKGHDEYKGTKQTVLTRCKIA